VRTTEKPTNQSKIKQAMPQTESIAVLMMACNRPSVVRALRSIFKLVIELLPVVIHNRRRYRPAQGFPVIVSQVRGDQARLNQS
jgi:hypothetical protein